MQVFSVVPHFYFVSKQCQSCPVPKYRRVKSACIDMLVIWCWGVLLLPLHSLVLCLEVCRGVAGFQQSQELGFCGIRETSRLSYFKSNQQLTIYLFITLFIITHYCSQSNINSPFIPYISTVLSTVKKLYNLSCLLINQSINQYQSELSTAQPQLVCLID